MKKVLKQTVTIEVEGTNKRKLESALAVACDKILAGYPSCAGSSDDQSSRYMILMTKTVKV
jgi:hypothetical protein